MFEDLDTEQQTVIARQTDITKRIRMMKAPTGMSPEQWIQECVSSTLAAPVDQSIQSDLLHGISLFGGIIYTDELLERLIPEALMQESKMYQLYKRRTIRETTIKHILMLLEQQFHPDAVRALTPAIEKIEDLQRLEQIFRAAAKPQNLETFAQMVHE